jgi:hypothetical protein
MSEPTEQTAALTDAVPARIQLDDFIEAVTRGVTRALAVQDEVSGYAANVGSVRAPITVLAGFFPFPPTSPYEDFASVGSASGGGGISVRGGVS